MATKRSRSWVIIFFFFKRWQRRQRQRDDKEDKEVTKAQLEAEWAKFKFDLDAWKSLVPPSTAQGSSEKSSTPTPLEWALQQVLKMKSEYGYFYPLIVELAKVALSAPITNAWPERGASAVKRTRNTADYRGLLFWPTKTPPQQLPWNLFWLTKAPSAILLQLHWMQSSWNLLKNNCKKKCAWPRRPSSCLTRTLIQTVILHGTAWATLKFNMQRNICHLSELLIFVQHEPIF